MPKCNLITPPTNSSGAIINGGSGVNTDLMMNPNSIQEKLNYTSQNLKFPSSSSNLTSSAVNALNDVATIMQANSSLNLNINGYTDSQGNDVTNQQLSASRAKASYDYLVSQGISPERLNYRGYGEPNPVASNTTEASRFRNRRVEFILMDDTGRPLINKIRVIIVTIMIQVVIVVRGIQFLTCRPIKHLESYLAWELIQNSVIHTHWMLLVFIKN